MKYISAEEFLKQPEEVQKIFINWWQPSLGDLYVKDNYLKALPHCVWQSDNGLIFPIRGSLWEEKKKCIPLLTEGQLRKLVEYKINSKIEIVFVDKEGVDGEESYYRIERVHYLDGNLKDSVWITNETDLLQAYWKVALEIAKQEIKGGINP